MNKDIYVLGVGRNTPVFIDLAEQCGYSVRGLYHYNDSRTGEYDHDYKILGSFDDLFSLDSLKNKSFILSMGDNKIRSELAYQIWSLGGETPNLIHPTSIISKFAQLGKGIYVSAFSFIQADTVIGDGTIILSGVNISHTNKVGDFCFIAGGAIIGAYTKIENFVMIGISATIVSGKVPYIGINAVIGAGAVVIKPVEDYQIVLGNPAIPLKTK